MKSFNEIKNRLIGITGIHKEKTPVRIAIESLFSESFGSAIQTGNFSDAENRIFIVITALNELLFNLELYASKYDFCDEVVKEEFKKVYKTNNKILRNIFLVSKSTNSKGIDSLVNIFRDNYTYNESMMPLQNGKPQ